MKEKTKFSGYVHFFGKGGLRFSDVVLKWKTFNAKENRITKTIRKNWSST